MRLPTPLLRRKKKAYKNLFGHVLVLAGSRRMLGAAALCGLSAMRSGAGLVTVGIPTSLNSAAHKKLSSVIMTLPLNETAEQSLAMTGYKHIQKNFHKFNAIAIGPGLSQHTSTQKLIRRIIETSPIPLIIDADALNALAGHCPILKKTKTAKILTPHTGEMARLIKKNSAYIQSNRKTVAGQFSNQCHCTLVLKGAQTVVAQFGKKIYTNTKSGNAGMATAGSGDVLTGMIAAFVAQGLGAFDAAKFGVFLHGRAGDLAARAKTQTSMIAEDIIDYIPKALKKST